MRFLLLAIVLAFPLVDLYATVRIARWTGVPVWAWLGTALAAGLFLLANERVAFRANLAAAMHGEQPLLRGLLDSGRKVLAGFLLVVPGVISDVLALVLLALPLNVGSRFEPQPAGAGRHGAPRGDALDADFRRID
ncbi:MAG: FxsA family protein [Betaproteobacteria bacterium]